MLPSKTVLCGEAKDAVPLSCNPSAKMNYAGHSNHVRANLAELPRTAVLCRAPQYPQSSPVARITVVQKFLLLTRRAFPCDNREAVRRGTTPPGPERPCPADTASPCCRQVPHAADNGSSIPQKSGFAVVSATTPYGNSPDCSPVWKVSEASGKHDPRF